MLTRILLLVSMAATGQAFAQSGDVRIVEVSGYAQGFRVFNPELEAGVVSEAMSDAHEKAMVICGGEASLDESFAPRLSKRHTCGQGLVVDATARFICNE